MQEDLNFLLTNRVPRILLTHVMGRLSKIRSRRLARLGIGLWRVFTDLDLSEAHHQEFESLHDCFVRELRPGMRPIDPDPAVLASPCDGIVGAMGQASGTEVFQAKGFPYSIEELLGDAAMAAPFKDGTFITLRLTSAMYHRFHAPESGRVDSVTYISGDTWNVNPIALRRVEKLFCRNERVAIRMRLHDGQPAALVAVAAILVASVRLHFLDVLLHLRWRGPNFIPCNHAVRRGEELGWFEHGSTIILFVPEAFKPCAGIAPGSRVRMGQAILSRSA
jgi:phosphatidylserine decarboxylase